MAESEKHWLRSSILQSRLGPMGRIRSPQHTLSWYLFWDCISSALLHALSLCSASDSEPVEDFATPYKAPNACYWIALEFLPIPSWRGFRPASWSWTCPVSPSFLPLYCSPAIASQRLAPPYELFLRISFSRSPKFQVPKAGHLSAFSHRTSSLLRGTSWSSE